MAELKSNFQTGSIFCKDCNYLELHKVLGFRCNQFNSNIRSIRERLVEKPIKCLECTTYGATNPNVY